MIIREANADDAVQMAEVLNAIIALGGTTAHEAPKSARHVLDDYVDGPNVLSSVIAEEGDQVVGWQSVGWWHGEPHIGTFVRPGIQAKGAGRAMFARTCDLLRAAEIGYVIAWIRADNVPGLAFYARIGFRDIGEDTEFALQDGRKVGRIHRRFDLTSGALQAER